MRHYCAGENGILCQDKGYCIWGNWTYQGKLDIIVSGEIGQFCVKGKGTILCNGKGTVSGEIDNIMSGKRDIVPEEVEHCVRGNGHYARANGTLCQGEIGQCCVKGKMTILWAIM